MCSIIRSVSASFSNPSFLSLALNSFSEILKSFFIVAIFLFVSSITLSLRVPCIVLVTNFR